MKNVTVLMSSYNGEKYIREQIDSILQQKDVKVTLLVRDDGSSDATLDILEDYQRKGFLTYFQGINCGPAKSFLKLLKECPSNDYYAFADQDDIWMSNKLSAGISLLEHMSTIPALYSSNMRRVDKNGNNISEYALPSEVKTDFESVMTVSGRLFGCTMIFNDRLAQIIKAKDIPEYIVMHDLWLALVASLYNGLIYDKNAYIKYRTHDSSVTYSKNIPLLKKVKSMFCGSKDSFSELCQSFVDYIGEETIKAQLHWNICYLILTYKKSLIKKIKLQMIMITKKDMSLKLRIHHVVQILFGKY